MIAALLSRLAAALERAADRIRGDAPLVVATRDDAIAIAVHRSATGEYVVVHERACGDDCTCTRPEVYRVERGRA